jgi:hypothetical protein
MPFFKTNQNIFVDNGEYFDPNWMDSNELILPKNEKWKYERELKIEDINIWECLWMAGGGHGVYAAWDPYAEFYMIVVSKQTIETYYGPGAQHEVYRRCHELGIPISVNKIWIDDDEMWLHEKTKFIVKNPIQTTGLGNQT